MSSALSLPFRGALLGLLFFFIGAGLPALRAQRQMENLGRGVVAARTSSTQVYIGWRLLGDDPSAVGFNIYRSVGSAAATKINGASPITASTNYVDTPGSTALASAISYYVVPVLNGVEQAPSAAYALPANATSGRQYQTLPLATAFPNPASAAAYDVKFCWVGDFDGDGEYDFLVDRVSTAATEERQYLEAYKRDGTFLWRMDMGVNSVNQYAYEPGASAISIGDTDNVTVYDLDGDGKAEVAVRTANGVTVTNAAGTVVATISAASNTAQFVSIINGLTGAELARATLPNPWSQHGTLTNKCAVGYFDGLRPSVLFYGYNRADSGAFNRVFTTFDYRNGQLTQRWTLPQTFAGAEGHQIRIADVDNDGKDEICDIGHVIDDNGTQLFVIPEISHGDRFHIADINPDRPGLENYIIQQNNPSFLATAYYDAGTGQMLKKWYATDVVDVGRGIALDINSTHKGYEMYSTQPGIYNAKAQQIYANNVWAPEGLWWDTDLLREFVDGAGSGALNPVIAKFNQTSGVTDRVWTLYNDGGNFSTHQAYGGRPAFWGDILGDWREELVFVTSDYTALRIYTTTNVATNRLYTLMHNPAYRTQATTKGYVQSSNVDYYLGVGMTVPPPPPMVPARLAWSGGAGASTWDAGSTAAWKNTATSAASAFAAGDSVRFDLAGNNSASVALSGALEPGAVTVYSPIDYTFDGAAGSLGGAMTLVKAGKGSLRLTGPNGFTGATTVWDGALRVDGALTGSAVTVWGGTWGGALAKGITGGRLAGSGSVAQPVSLQYRGALTPGAGMGVSGTLSLGAGLAAADGSVLAFDLSTDPTGATLANDLLAITGNLSLSGTVSIVIAPLSGQLTPGTYTLATYTGSLTGSISNLSVVVPDGTPYSVSLAAGALTLTVPVTRATGGVTWTGSVSGAWDLAGTANWRFSGSSDVFVSGDTVTFDDTGSARPAVTLNVAAPVGGLTFSGATNYTLSGSGSVAGSGGLTKTGSGTVTLNTTNSFTGPVSVTGGVLAIDNLNDGGEPSSIGASSAAASNFVLNGGALRLIGSQTNTNRALTLGSNGGSIDIPTGSATLQISGGITGSGALTKTGAGALIVATANTYSGGTVLQAGTLILASDAANTSGLGSGGITLQGGTLRMYDNTGSYNTSSWPINVPTGASARFEPDGRLTLASALTGSGTLEFYTSYIRTDLTGNWSAFTGTLNVTADSDGGDFRISNTNGYANASVNFANLVYAYALGGSTSIGALSGANGATMASTAWTVGAKNLSSSYAGTITGNSLTKVGTGVLTLAPAGTTSLATTTVSGSATATLTSTSTLRVNMPVTGTGIPAGTTIAAIPSATTITLSKAATAASTANRTYRSINTYTGATTVSAGGLLVNGTLSGSAVTVGASGALGGTGSIFGNVSFGSGATFLANPAAPLAIVGNLAFGGAMTVAPAPGTTPVAGTYVLYTYTGSLTGSPVFTWTGAGFNATFNTATANQVSVTLVPGTLPPTNLTALAGDNTATLSWSASSTAASYSVLRSTVSGGPYTTIATGLTSSGYADTGLTNGITYYYVVTAVASGGGSANSEQASVSVGGLLPRVYLRLDEIAGATATDSSGNGWHGTLVASPARGAGRLNNGVTLASASSQYATLPANVVGPLNDFTLSLWVKMTSFTTWARLVDFGTGSTNYLFLTPRSSTGNARFAIRTSSVTEQIIDGSATVPIGTWAHLAVTLSGSTGTLYLNGVAIGSNTAMTLKPSSLGVTTLNYLGKSQFAADPYLNGAIDEFQIRDRALTAGEIATLANPLAAPGGVNIVAGQEQTTLSWTAVAGATGYAVKRSPVAGGPYAVVATGLAATSYVDSGLTPATPYYYVVTALQPVAESAHSAEVAATPTAPLSPMDDWRVTHFGSATATGEAADAADPDADGIANLLEYALGGDPLLAGAGILPVTTVTADHLALVFNRVADPTLTYRVQAVSDLASPWADIWSSTGTDNTDGPLTVPDPDSITAHPRRFLRLQVTR